MIIDNLSYEMLSPDFTGNLATAIMTVPQILLHQIIF